MMKHSILVVDDEEFNRQIILDILAQAEENYPVLTANSGKIGCKLALKVLPDLILMDWKMPEMTGIEAVKKLKSQKETRDIPVIMITAVTLPGKLKEAFEAGVVDYVTKPVKDIELLVRVRSVIKTNMYYKKILRQKEKIEAQKKDITDSIRYARNIQGAILPKIEEIQSVLTESFVIFKPKDIVSGDFYWFTQKNERVIIAACDCTGHGVPGAFVSMIGNDLLNQMIIEKDIDNPGEILSLLSIGMKSVFTRTGSEQQAKDGMDMALISLKLAQSPALGGTTLQYAGANNPLYIIRKGEKSSEIYKEALPFGKGLEGAVIKADKQPIGGRTKLNYHFTNHEIELQKGDTIYIFSDGYQDQFGGEKNKKFMSKRFRQLLLNIQGKSMKEQKQILVQTIEKWKGDKTQLDDILVIGVRV